MWLGIPAQRNDQFIRLNRERDRLHLALRYGFVEHDADRGEDRVPCVRIDVDLNPDAEIREVSYANSLIQHCADALIRLTELGSADHERRHSTVDIDEPFAIRYSI